METFLNNIFLFFINKFLSYLWGMETQFGISFKPNLSNVLILPMRNGNEYEVEYTKDKIECSYPTYEEWKLCLLYMIKQQVI